LAQVYDARNDEELRLNDDEVRFLRRLQKNKFEQVRLTCAFTTRDVTSQ